MSQSRAELEAEIRRLRAELERVRRGEAEPGRPFHDIFEHIQGGGAVHEIVLDDRGQPVDYRFLAANPAFGRLTGLDPDGVIGKTVREILPGIERSWIEKFGKVPLTGTPMHFQQPTHRPRHADGLQPDQRPGRTHRGRQRAGQRDGSAALPPRRDGAEALRLFHAHEAAIDLVISDSVMPRLSGADVYDALRTHEPPIRFLMVQRLLARGGPREGSPHGDRPVPAQAVDAHRAGPAGARRARLGRRRRHRGGDSRYRLSRAPSVASRRS